MHGPLTDAGSRGCSLRSLDQRGRTVALVVGLLLVALFALSAGRALADGWMPTGDEALLALRAHDVLDGHPPLVGQPSTSRTAGGKATNHPGPIQAWLFAIPVRILGSAAGMRWSAAAVNAAAVLTAVWVVLRRAGPSMALAAAVVLALVGGPRAPISRRIRSARTRALYPRWRWRSSAGRCSGAISASPRSWCWSAASPPNNT